jgi:ABC-type glycerol-3-phosphate transport system permease component
MPIISTVGRRSLSLQMVIAALYLILIAGSVTIVYPFLLMLSTSVTSAVDVDEYRIIPAYLHDDDAVAAKYIEEKYVTLTSVAAAYALEGVDFPGLTKLVRAERAKQSARPIGAMQAELADWRDFVAQLPIAYQAVVFQSPQGMTGRTDAGFRAYAQSKYSGDLARCREEYREEIVRFGAIALPFERIAERDYLPEHSIKFDDFLAYKAGLAREDLSVARIDVAWANFVRSNYRGALADMNRDFGTAHASFQDLHLRELAPETPGVERDLWLRFVRERLGFTCIGVRDGAQRFAGYLTYQSEKPSADGAWRSNVIDHFDSPDLSAIAPQAARFNDFVQREKAQNLAVLSPENLYRRFLAQRYGSIAKLNETYGTEHTDWLPIAPPALAADIATAVSRASELRWHFLGRNYREVVDFLVLHGRSVWNTGVLVVLSLLTQLIVNPLAAYALSRFQLPYTNKILIFCLATMAFPPEVAMIPNFLLLRNFPAAQLVVALTTFVLIFSLYALIMRKHAPLWIGILLGLIAGAVATQAIPGGKVSLLNTYWALILPGVANGFSIFLLKGFFDTLPKEVFEAATMEGASEMRMFWQISLPMCLPVLAVIALGTFTATYGSFMWAFLVCQKEEMWTLMVWLYEMQQWAPKYLMTAALVVAAIPTLLIFILCQRFILRGIVLPSLH